MPMTQQPTQPEPLREEWLRNEAELERLRDLPVSAQDPATRERALERRQDEIEFEIGRRALKNDP
jgi:hypothetical protein